MNHKYYFILGLTALTIAGIMLALVIGRYYSTGFDKAVAYYTLGFLGTLIAGINFILANKKLRNGRS